MSNSALIELTVKMLYLKVGMLKESVFWNKKNNFCQIL